MGCGDMTHEMEDRKKQEEEVQTFKQIYSKIEDHIPLICVCGNHDVGDLKSSAFSLSRYKDRFGDDYFAFHVGGVKYIVFNSQLYVDPGEAERDSRAQNVWLDGELASDHNAVHTVAFCHIPPFIDEPDEGEGHFNMPTKKRNDLLDKLNDAEVSHLFCGHYHRNAGGTYKDLEVSVSASIGTNVVNSSIPGSDPLDKSGIGDYICEDDTSGFRIVAVKKDKIVHKWFSFDDIEQEFTDLIVTQEKVFEALNDTMDATILRMMSQREIIERESYFNPLTASMVANAL